MEEGRDVAVQGVSLSGLRMCFLLEVPEAVVRLCL
jgi:hypothetical protein